MFGLAWKVVFPLLLKDEIKLTVRRTDTEKVKTTVHYEEPLAAPIKQGQIVGTLKIKVAQPDTEGIPFICKTAH